MHKSSATLNRNANAFLCKKAERHYFSGKSVKESTKRLQR